MGLWKIKMQEFLNSTILGNTIDASKINCDKYIKKFSK